MLVDNTPVEPHVIDGRTIWVKREDLCCPYPGPSFSKMRGVVAHIKQRYEPVIGVLDTYHSKAGWAVAWACKQLGKQCMDFWPRYKADGERPTNLVREWPPRRQQREAKALGASLLDLPAGRSAVLYHMAKKRMARLFDDHYLMPNALKLPESITENAAEARRTIRSNAIPPRGWLVLSISSGTVAAGVLKGFNDLDVLDNYRVILHHGYSRSSDATLKYMERVSGVSLSSVVKFVDEGYDYKAAAKGVEAPFPCNEHYDLKAWKWLTHHAAELGGHITFWNIGD